MCWPQRCSPAPPGHTFFASELGTPLNARNVQRFLDSALKKAGLPDVPFHDLRHTAGTLLMRHDGRVVAR